MIPQNGHDIYKVWFYRGFFRVGVRLRFFSRNRLTVLFCPLTFRSGNVDPPKIRIVKRTIMRVEVTNIRKFILWFLNIQTSWLKKNSAMRLVFSTCLSVFWTIKCVCKSQSGVYSPLNHIIHCDFRFIFTFRNRFVKADKGKIFAALPSRQRH